jgi:hypothetical protein
VTTTAAKIATIIIGAENQIGQSIVMTPASG